MSAVAGFVRLRFLAPRLSVTCMPAARWSKKARSATPARRRAVARVTSWATAARMCGGGAPARRLSIVRCVGSGARACFVVRVLCVTVGRIYVCPTLNSARLRFLALRARTQASGSKCGGFLMPVTDCRLRQTEFYVSKRVAGAPRGKKASGQRGQRARERFQDRTPRH